MLSDGNSLLNMGTYRGFEEQNTESLQVPVFSVPPDFTTKEFLSRIRLIRTTISQFVVICLNSPSCQINQT